jgi:hypothetical protein
MMNKREQLDSIYSGKPFNLYLDDCTFFKFKVRARPEIEFSDLLLSTCKKWVKITTIHSQYTVMKKGCIFASDTDLINIAYYEAAMQFNKRVINLFRSLK